MKGLLQLWKGRGEDNGLGEQGRVILLLKVIFNLLNVFGLGLKNHRFRGNLLFRGRFKYLGMEKINNKRIMNEKGKADVVVCKLSFFGVPSPFLLVVYHSFIYSFLVFLYNIKEKFFQNIINTNIKEELTAFCRLFFISIQYT